MHYYSVVRMLIQRLFIIGSSVPPRDPSFATIDAADVAHFRSLLGDSNVITDAASLDAYNTDWMRKYRGASRLALRPQTTAQARHFPQKPRVAPCPVHLPPRFWSL